MIEKWGRALLAVVLVAGVLISCDDNPGDNTDEERYAIEATHIIVNPKSPAPGDTIQLTVRLVSDTTNAGDFPSMNWSASGGTFLESDQMSVRWIAPSLSSLVTISVTAKNLVNTTSIATTVFVGQSTQLVASNAGQPFLRPNGSDFVFMHTTAVGAGVEMWEYVGGAQFDLVPGTLLGGAITVAPSLTGAAFEIQTPPAGNFIEPINVYYSDLDLHTNVAVTTDNAIVGSRRRQQYTRPFLSKTGRLLVIQAYLTALFSSDSDSLDVLVYDTVNKSKLNATKTHGIIRKNLFPSVSPDEKWLVFVSDRNQTNRWEFYGLPIDGSYNVATDSASTVRLTNTNGQVTSGSIQTVTQPFTRWNPVLPILAFVSSTGRTYVVSLDSQGGTLTEVTGLQNKIMREFVWSPDGTRLAMTDGTTIFSVPSSGGAATIWHQVQTGDLGRDLTWSPGLDYIIFRTTRGGNSWFEVIDTGAGTLEQSVVLTPASGSGDVGGYRRVMSTSAVFNPNGEILYLDFGNGTPAVRLLDVNAALQ